MTTLTTCAVDGVLYKAEPPRDDTNICNGCAGNRDAALCANLGACVVGDDDDIIWVRAEV